MATNDFLSRLIKKPLENIGIEISDMVECADKISRLEEQAIKFPNVETLTAKIKRANDFTALLSAVAKTKFEIQMFYKAIQAQLKEKQIEYTKLDEEYEKLYNKLRTSLINSSEQISTVGEAYLEKEYAAKFKELLSKIDHIISSLNGKITTLDTRIKAIENQIQTLDTQIEDDTKKLIEIIDTLTGSNTEFVIKKDKFDISVYNEQGEKIIAAEENQKTISREVTFDENEAIQFMNNFMKATSEKKESPPLKNMTEELGAFIKQRMIIKASHNIKFTDQAAKNAPIILSNMPEVDKISKKYAQETIDKIEKNPVYTLLLEKAKNIQSLKQQRECLMQEKNVCIEQKNIYKAHITSLEKHVQELPVKEINTNTLDALQKIIDQASFEIKQAKTTEPAQIKSTSKEPTLDEPPPPTKTTRPGRA